MQRAARTTALIIVPLASAINAHAFPLGTGPILPTDNVSCTFLNTPTVGSPFGGSCGGGSNSLPALGPNGITGMSLSTTSPVTFSGGGTALLTLSASGLLTQADIPSGSTIPLGYFFDLSFQDGGLSAAATGWSLDFQLLDGSTVIGDSGAITGVPGDTSLSGGAFFGDVSSMTTTADAFVNDTLTERVTLSVTWTAGDLDQLVVEVPTPSTFDYDPTEGVASVPEPGTMALTGSAFALGGFFLLRRKKGWTLTRSGR